MANRKCILKKEIYDNYLRQIEKHKTKGNIVIRNIIKKFFNDNNYKIKELKQSMFEKTLLISTFNLSSKEEIAINFTFTDEDLKLLLEISKETGLHLKNILEILIFEFTQMEYEEQKKLYLL